MNAFKIMALIIVSISFAFLMYSLTSNLWFFRKEEKVEGGKDLIIYRILQLAYDCYEKNFNLKSSVICGGFKIVSKEDILASDILSRLDTRKIDKKNIFVENLRANSKVVVRYENGNIFIGEEKYERISS